LDFFVIITLIKLNENIKRCISIFSKHHWKLLSTYILKMNLFLYLYLSIHLGC
jgi:hypothetical protein